MNIAQTQRKVDDFPKKVKKNRTTPSMYGVYAVIRESILQRPFFLFLIILIAATNIRQWNMNEREKWIGVANDTNEQQPV